MEKSQMSGILISVFVALLIGTILVDVIATESNKVSELTGRTETVLLAREGTSGPEINTSVWRQLTYGCPYQDAWREDAGCAISSVVVKNSSGATMTENTDYVLNLTAEQCANYQNGDIRFLNTTALNMSASNTTTVSYYYCADQYLTQSWSRTVLDLVPGFFVLAILGASIFAIVWFMRKEGIIG